MMVIGRSGLAVLLLPPGHVLQLPGLSFSEIVGELRLLQGMPVVQNPVRGNHLSLEGTSSGTLSDCKGTRLIAAP